MTGAGLVAHETRFDLLSFWRNGQSRFFTLFLPVLFLVIFATVFGDDTVEIAGREINETTYYVPNIVALGIVQAAVSNLAISVVAQRESGVLKRRRSTPVPAAVIIAGRALSAVVVSWLIVIVIALVGRLAYGVALPTNALPAAIVTVTVGAAALCCVGYALTTFITTEDSATPVLQAIVLPLYFISGVFIPEDTVPDWLLRVADVFPIRPLAQALLHAFDPATTGAGFQWGHLAIVVAWGLAGLVVAVRRFSWSPRATD